VAEVQVAVVAVRGVVVRVVAAAAAEARAVEVAAVRAVAARVEDKAAAGIGSSPEPASTTARSPALPVLAVSCR